MRNPMRRTEASGGLVDIIHDVRRRWRYKLALRGAVGVLGLGVAVAAALGIRARVVALQRRLDRHVPGRAGAGARRAGRLVPRPGRCCASVSDEQVALYLEEHEPSLQAAIVSAVEMSAVNAASTAESPHSAALVRAPRRVRGREVPGDRQQDARSSGGRYGATPAPSRRLPLSTLAVFSLGPAYLRHALSALLIVSRSVEAAAPYRIEVTPGNATVPRGVDQTITAKLEGFDSEQAALMVRKSPDAPFERMTLAAFRDGGGRHTSTRACCSTSPGRSTTSSRRPACDRRRTR